MKTHTISQALRILNERAAEAAKQRYPNVPDYARPKPKFSDKTANELTKAIVSWLKLEGCQAERISVTGRMVDERKTFTDVIGRQRTVGSVTWIKSSMQKGSADISATIAGQSVKIEIKMPGDRQSDDQKVYQAEVEAAGGVYLTVGNFQDFYEWHQVFIKKGATNEKQ